MAGYYPQLVGIALDAFQKTAKILKERAMRELNLTSENVILRALLPTDLGIATPAWTFTADGAGWYTMIDTTILNNRYISINGFGLSQITVPATTEIEITRAGTVAREYNLQNIWTQDDHILYVDDPFTVDQNTKVTIRGYATGAGTDLITFIGLVAEKRGLKVNP